MPMSALSLTFRPSACRGFTLVELLVAMVISLFIMGIVLSVATQASSLWISSTAKLEAFQGARTAFDLITRNLSQATLNSYMGYDSSSNPSRYLRLSDLRFFCGNAASIGTPAQVPGIANTGQGVFFMAPSSYTANVASYGGMESLLNVCGFYVSYCQNSTVPSYVPSSANPYRYRLMELLVPTETANSVYLAAGNAWFSAFTSYSIPVADDVVALIIRPEDPSASPPTDLTSNTYTYDSTASALTSNPQVVTANQLPPVVLVTMVAVDEKSAKEMNSGATQPTVISSLLSGKFIKPSNFSSDLQNLETALDGAKPKIAYRVFSSTVSIREAKWTK